MDGTHPRSSVDSVQLVNLAWLTIEPEVNRQACSPWGLPVEKAVDSLLKRRLTIEPEVNRQACSPWELPVANVFAQKNLACRGTSHKKNFGTMGMIASRPQLIQQWEANPMDPGVIAHLESSPGFQRCLVQHIGEQHGYPYELTGTYWSNVKPLIQGRLLISTFHIIQRTFHNHGAFADDEDPNHFGYAMRDGKWVAVRPLDQVDRQCELWYHAAERVRQGIYRPLDITDEQKIDAILDCKKAYKKVGYLQNRVTVLETELYTKTRQLRLLERRVTELERVVFQTDSEEDEDENNAEEVDRTQPVEQIPEGGELPTDDRDV